MALALRTVLGASNEAKSDGTASPVNYLKGSRPHGCATTESWEEVDVFSDWNSRFPRGEGVDHRSSPLTPDSVLMRQGVGSPRPQPTYWASWSWYENAIQVRAHLLYVVLPDMAALWLNEGSFGLNSPRVPFAETISSSTSGNETDRQYLIELANELSQASAPTNHELALQLQELAAGFTERFGRTPTWDLQIEVFPSVPEGGAFLFDENPDEFTVGNNNVVSRDEWLALCQEASIDGEASRVVEQKFADSFLL